MTGRPAAAYSHLQLTRLKWLAVVVPSLAVVVYETARHEVLERYLPAGLYGHLVVGLVAFGVFYLFAEAGFRVISRLQAATLREGEERAAIAAALQERERLSRDLHDGFGQLVSYLLVRLDTVAQLVAGNQSAQAAREIAHLREVTNELYEDVRESISGLRTGLTGQSLAAALERYAQEFEDRHGILVRVQTAPGATDAPSPTANLHLFRIAQEALANVRKHAHAAQVDIALQTGPDGALVLTIADDGTGFKRRTDEQRATFGLVSMRERAEELGGTFDLTSDASGTRVCVRVPPRGVDA